MESQKWQLKEYNHCDLPSWIFKNIPHDGVGHNTVVEAHTNVGAPHLILLTDFIKPPKKLIFILRTK